MDYSHEDIVDTIVDELVLYNNMITAVDQFLNKNISLIEYSMRLMEFEGSFEEGGDTIFELFDTLCDKIESPKEK